MLFHICFVALLTLVICAPTGETVLRKLMLIGESKYEKAIRRDVEACIHDQAAVTLKKAFESVVQVGSCVAIMVLEYTTWFGLVWFGRFYLPVPVPYIHLLASKSDRLSNR